MLARWFVLDVSAAGRPVSLCIAGAACYRQLQLRTQAAVLAVAQGQARAECLTQLQGDGQAQTSAAGAAVARALHPVERLEHFLQLRLGDAGAFVQYLQAYAVLVVLHPQLGTAGELEGVVNQVAEYPAQRMRSGFHQGAAAAVEAHRLAAVLVVEHQAVEEGIQVDPAQRLAAAVHAARIGYAFAHQVLHLVEVTPKALALRRVVHLLDAQLHACDWRLQVVGDGRQQLHPLFQVGGDTPL